MRRVLTWIGSAALLLFLVVVAGFGYLAFLGSGLDSESRTYADTVPQPIIGHWDPNALKEHASPALLASIQPEKLDAMFTWFATLGKLKTLEPCSGQSRIDITTQHGRVTTGQYTCKAHFQNGDATVQLLLIRTQASWRIHGFHVNSPALLPREAAGKL